ncbi:MAG: glycerol-3-phosphate responsive antiterminator [Candidatus Limnocylindrales bacterium]
MLDRLAHPYLLRVFVASTGREHISGAGELAVGTLLRDIDLMTLVRVAEAGPEGIAVDLDSVDGLNADDAGARFVVGRLGIRIVMTRRPALAALVAEAGCLGLVHVFAFDSTGLGRALESRTVPHGVGTVISPGPVLSHMTTDDLERLPRPIVAYGLIDSPDRARRLLTIADSVVVGPECATGLVQGAGFPVDDRLGRAQEGERSGRPKPDGGARTPD